VKSCSTCASSLFSDVKYCPFCGTGTRADARAKQTAATPATAPVKETVVATPRAKRTPEPVPARPPAPAPQVPPTSVVPAAPAAPVRPTPAPIPAETPPVPPKGGVGKWIVLAVVLAGLFLYFKGKPDQNELACNTAFDAGNKALLAKDMAGARSQALLANGVCTGTARSKAQSLQTAIESAETASTGCLRNFRAFDSHLDDRKLTSARDALNELSSTCSADPAAAEDRKKLSAAVAATQAAQATLREALDAKNVAGAKTAYANLAGLNRENGDLAVLRTELDQMTAAAVAAAEAPPVVVAPAAELAPVQAPASAPVRAMEAPRAFVPVPAAARRQESDSGAGVKAEMAASFLRDAENALGQKKFDAAKTYVESARRMDPNNPRLDGMLQQIRDREHQVLQSESTIR
jgi:hypothetical protein